MILELKMTSDIPIYQQIYEQVLLGMAKGELLLGESLPTVRQLADDLGVNAMTISKAYNLLKEDGYIETDRRSGSKVVQQVAHKEAFITNFELKMELLLAEGTVNGYKDHDFIDLLNQLSHKFTYQRTDDK